MKFRDFMLLAILCTTTFFIYNTALPADIMEVRNIITAREIIDNDSWLYPTLNGVLQLEKPPLPTWVAAAIEYISPDSLGAQRMAAGVMAVVWITFFYYVALYLSQRKDYALYSTIIFMTCYNVVQMGRTASWDIYCNAFMMAAIYFLMRGLYDDYFKERQRPWLYLPLAGLMMGLSFLSKGPVAFYAQLLPALIAALIFIRPLDVREKWKPLAAMVVICLVVSGWWYVYLLLNHHEEVMAFLSQHAYWGTRIVRPWYYYWRFFCETGVWTTLMLTALMIPFWNKRLPERRGYLIAVTWTLVALVLLSLIPEKRVRYLLPMMTPCSLAMGYVIIYFKDYCHKDRQAERLFLLNGVVMSVVTFTLPVLVFIFGYQRDSMHLDSYVGITLLIVLAGLWIARATMNRDAGQLIFGVAALFAVICSFLLRPIANVFDNPDKNSIHQISKLDLPFYHKADENLRIELIYSARHQIKPLDLSDEKAVEKAMPCVVITRDDITKSLSGEQLKKIRLEPLGRFDDNKHPKGNEHYTADFINHATILRQR